MSRARLSPDAIARVSGPSWNALREVFLEMSDILLGVSPDAIGVLTTIYVKYQLKDTPNPGVFAVAWLKNSKQIVVGLALPDDYLSSSLGDAPMGLKYKGLTKYFTVKPGEPVPDLLNQWVADAYRHATAAKS